ncbi:hypothetical protein AHAS_Ahas16G0220300 [Arachis hypogaea]
MTMKITVLQNHFHVRHLHGDLHGPPTHEESKILGAAIYLQVSIISQALIFVTRSRGWSYIERPGVFLMIAFVITQLIATIVSAFLSWELAGIKAIGWSWMGIIWVYSIITYLFLDPIKFAVRYALSGRAWNLVVAKHSTFIAYYKRKMIRNFTWDHKKLLKRTRESFLC